MEWSDLGIIGAFGTVCSLKKFVSVSVSVPGFCLTVCLLSLSTLSSGLSVPKIHQWSVREIWMYCIIQKFPVIW